MAAPRFFSGIVEVDPDTDPGTIEAAIREHQPWMLQFSEPLSDDLLRAMSAALEGHPDVRLRAYGRRIDPSLAWLHWFVGVQRLSIDLWHVESFSNIQQLESLRFLWLGETKSTRPSLAFLGALPEIEELFVEGHARDFETIASLLRLRNLSLRVSKARTLDSLRGHPQLQVLAMDFGGIRDLGPLATLPSLRAVELFQVRKLDTSDLDPIGDCRHLVALSLGALRNVESLRALTRGPSETLRFLTMELLGGLATLGDLADCRALEEIFMVESKPKDGRLDRLAGAPALRHLVVGDHYDKAQVARTKQAFKGQTLWIRGESIAGDPDRSDVAVKWRRSVSEYLTL